VKVLLAVTFAEGALNLEKDDDIAHGMGIFPPLGILSLATYLKHNSSHDVYLLDADAEHLTLPQIEEHVRSFQPDVFGITTFTNCLRAVLDILKVVKRVRPECVTVVGGPHVSIYPRETLAFPEVDYAVAGDGEIAFLQLVNALASGKRDMDILTDLKTVEGIVLRTPDGSIFENGYARITDLDGLPFPDRSLLNRERYYCILGKKRLMTTMATSRGCPFRCTFCNSPDKIYRGRSASNIVDEMEYVIGQGIEEIFFFDDLFNLNRKRVLDICDEIIKRRLNGRVDWSFRGRVNSLVDDDVVRRLKEAGCKRVQLGIEKATDASLRQIRKNTTVAEIEKAVELLHKYGIESVGNFVLFTPGEDEHDVEEIIGFSLKLKLDHAEYHVFAPYPKSEIYETGLRTGLFKEDFWAHYAKDPRAGMTYLWEEKVSRAKMFKIANRAYGRFYFRPRIVWRELRSISDWSVLKRKLWGAMTVLKLQK
jgi:anaerobic magnesium-protoporphyrin IX monomethyl ester cyclase